MNNHNIVTTALFNSNTSHFMKNARKNTNENFNSSLNRSDNFTHTNQNFLSENNRNFNHSEKEERNLLKYKKEDIGYVNKRMMRKKSFNDNYLISGNLKIISSKTNRIFRNYKINNHYNQLGTTESIVSPRNTKNILHKSTEENFYYKERNNFENSMENSILPYKNYFEEKIILKKSNSEVFFENDKSNFNVNNLSRISNDELINNSNYILDNEKNILKNENNFIGILNNSDNTNQIFLNAKSKSDLDLKINNIKIEYDNEDSQNYNNLSNNIYPYRINKYNTDKELNNFIKKDHNISVDMKEKNENFNNFRDNHLIINDDILENLMTFKIKENKELDKNDKLNISENYVFSKISEENNILVYTNYKNNINTNYNDKNHSIEMVKKSSNKEIFEDIFINYFENKKELFKLKDNKIEDISNFENNQEDGDNFTQIKKENKTENIQEFIFFKGKISLLI